MTALWCGIAVSSYHVQVSAACAAEISISPVEQWACIFGGEQVTFHFDITTKEAASVNVAWALAINERVIARRTATVDAAADKPGQLEIVVELPEPRPGIVVPVTLKIDASHGEASSAVVRQLWLYSKNLSSVQQESLKHISIHLFDPVGNTARVLEKSGIEFARMRDVQAIAAIDDGLLLVGAGTSFREFSSLADAMIELAERRIPVLCLTPIESQFAVPGIGISDPRKPESVSCQRASILHQYDKRFDFESWPPDGRVAARGIEFQANRIEVTGVVSESERAWPWLELRYAKPSGRLVICGFAIIEKWDASPVPRYFLVQLLQDLARKTGQSEVDPPERKLLNSKIEGTP